MLKQRKDFATKAATESCFSYEQVLELYDAVAGDEWAVRHCIEYSNIVGQSLHAGSAHMRQAYFGTFAKSSYDLAIAGHELAESLSKTFFIRKLNSIFK